MKVETAGSARPALELCLFPFKSADFLLAIAGLAWPYLHGWPYLRLRLRVSLRASGAKKTKWKSLENTNELLRLPSSENIISSIMSAGALKRRSLFHGQRKRQKKKKTATGRTEQWPKI